MKLSTSVICLLLIITTGFSQKLGRYTLEEWQTVIDTTWDEGLPTEDKLQIFDGYWSAVDAHYPGFNNLDVDWQELYDLYRPEVAEDVSRGRFAAIMNQLVLALNKIHTHANDLVVRRDSLHPGTPLLVFHSIYQPFNNSHLGAGLTPLPDSSALVFDVVDNHPLGLQRGDRILGYDGIPWKYLYQEFLAAELLITGPAYISAGTSEKSISHMWLMSAGLNWHLCDTIDILKYGSTDTLHLPTSTLMNQNMYLFCAEQLPVAGIPMIDLSKFWDEANVSWGIVENTHIGYIYVSRWRELEGPAFTNAINTLLDDYQTTGLILDFRGNPGGHVKHAYGGFRRLFNSDQKVFGFSERSDPDDHFAMKPASAISTDFTGLYNTDHHLYDRPIAVLTGPMTFSSAEYNSLLLKFHPMTRLFGKPTNTGFTYFPVTFHNVIENNPNYPNWEAGYAPMNAYLVSNPGNYLMHVGFDVDEEVWLTQEDVAKGEDTVVKRAIEWINNLAYAHDVTVNKTYAVPDNDSVIITAKVENPNQHELSVEAVIRNVDSTITDNLTMFDDGMHGDGAANDNLWGNFYLPTGEQSYKISVTTNDLTEETSRTLPNIAWFTTIGPIVFEKYRFSSSDTVANPGDRIRILLTLKNNSSTVSVTNIKARLICQDPSVDKIYQPLQGYGAIAPGEMIECTNSYILDIAEDCPVNTEIPFKIEITSNDYIFWYDSFNIHIYPTSIAEEKENIPKKFALDQNFPNPFNPITNIEYRIPKYVHVELSIYNLLGQRVITLVDQKQPAGSYQVQWDATGYVGGVYFYRLTNDTGFSETKKLLYLK